MPYIVGGYFKTIGGDAYGEAEKPERLPCSVARWDHRDTAGQRQIMVDPVLQHAEGACRKVEARIRSAPLPLRGFADGKYDHIVCDDMFKLLVWDCYAWSAWQFSK